jgi:hypothetical protein
MPLLVAARPSDPNGAQARAAQRLELAAKDKAPVQQEEESKLPAQGGAPTMCGPVQSPDVVPRARWF